MTLFKYMLPIVLAAGFGATVAYAEDVDQDGDRFGVELDQRDMDALRDFVNSKRTIDVKEKATNLTISGDVRAQWRHFTEKQDGDNLRGSGAFECFGGKESSSSDSASVSSGSSSSSSSFEGECFPVSRNDFNAEFNLRFDYVCDRAWAVAHLNFDDAMGVNSFGRGCSHDPEALYGSGEDDRIRLKKAYFGYNLCADGCSRFDIEVGRRGNLYNVFDSKIQFLSRFDGILLKYSSSWECVADWYINLAGFVVDERVNQFGWVGEIGFLNLCESGLDFKYSFIDWENFAQSQEHRRNRCGVHNPPGCKFRNSQFTLAYNFDQDCFCMPAKLYGAFLWNHSATTPGFRESGSSSSKEGHGNSAGNKEKDGANASQLEKKNLVTRKSTSSSDSSSSSSSSHNDSEKRFGGYVGFCFGEINCEGDFSFDMRYEIVEANAVPDGDVSGVGRGNVRNESYTEHGRGNTNYRGWIFEGLYALTDNLTIDTILEFSRQDDKRIGGSHSYSKFEIEAIYAF